MNWESLQQAANRLANKRWTAWAMLTLALALAGLGLSQMTERSTGLLAFSANPKNGTELTVLDHAETLVHGRPAAIAQLMGNTNNLFFTDFFKPPPPPTNSTPPPPPPPPPPPIKVPIVYQGFWVNSAGQRTAYFTIAGASATLKTGSVITGGLELVEFDFKQAILRNPSQTNVLPFNKPAELILPPASVDHGKSP